MNANATDTRTGPVEKEAAGTAVLSHESGQQAACPADPDVQFRVEAEYSLQTTEQPALDPVEFECADFPALS
jgi:hypothetical protein